MLVYKTTLYTFLYSILSLTTIPSQRQGILKQSRKYARKSFVEFFPVHAPPPASNVPRSSGFAIRLLWQAKIGISDIRKRTIETCDFAGFLLPSVVREKKACLLFRASDGNKGSIPTRLAAGEGERSKLLKPGVEPRGEYPLCKKMPLPKQGYYQGTRTRTLRAYGGDDSSLSTSSVSFAHRSVVVNALRPSHTRRRKQVSMLENSSAARSWSAAHALFTFVSKTSKILIAFESSRSIAFVLKAVRV